MKSQISARRRRTISILSVALMLPIVAACGSSGGSASTSSGTAQAMTDVTMSLTPGNAILLPIYYALRSGIFAKNHLNFKVIDASSGSANVDLVASGQADFSVATIATAALANERGADLRIATGLLNSELLGISCQKSLNIKGSYPSVMQSLAGKSIGISGLGTSTDNYLLYELLQAGVNPSSVKQVPVQGAGNYAAAVTSNAVDCVVVYPPLQWTLANVLQPVISQAANQGASMGAAGGTQTIVTQSYANAHPQIVREFQTSIAESLAQLKNTSSANVSRVSQLVAPDITGVSDSVREQIITALQTGLGDATLSASDVASADKIYAMVNKVELHLNLANVAVALPQG